MVVKGPVNGRSATGPVPDLPTTGAIHHRPGLEEKSVLLTTAVVVLALVLVGLTIAAVSLALLHSTRARAALPVAGAQVGDATSLPLHAGSRWCFVGLAALMCLFSHGDSPLRRVP
jgi:hypothetical protein